MKHTKAFVLATDPAVAFVAHPEERGTWLKVNPAVVFVTCPVCGAIPGMPCMSGASRGKRYMAVGHVDRQGEYQYRKKRGEIEHQSTPAFTVSADVQAALLQFFGAEGKKGRK